MPAIPAAATRKYLAQVDCVSYEGGLSRHFSGGEATPTCLPTPEASLVCLNPLTGFKMFAVGVGNAVEDELREIASEPVADHYFYTADFKTINQIGKKLQKKICVGE